MHLAVIPGYHLVKNLQKRKNCGQGYDKFLRMIQGCSTVQKHELTDGFLDYLHRSMCGGLDFGWVANNRTLDLPLTVHRACESNLKCYSSLMNAY